MTTHELITELRGERCRCGQTKTRGQTFCGGCYFALPKAMRDPLYQRVGQGYEEAYEAAARWLDKELRRATS